MTREKEVQVICQAPPESHPLVIYPMAVVSGTQNEKMAKAFIELTISDAGRNILQKYGFQSIP